MGELTERPGWAPADVDLNRPNVARLYDYFLGGSHHFAVDRQAAEAVLELAPEMLPAVRANRAFLQRAVRVAVAAGVDQFLDLGSGIPTVGNVHETARQLDPDARVVYVDIDTVAVAHATALVADDPGIAVLQADIREIAGILATPEVRGLIDFDRPVCVLLVAVLHFVGGDSRVIVDPLRAVLAPGSILAISVATRHPSRAGGPEAEAVRKLYERAANPVYLREIAEIEEIFTDLDLLPPGLVPVNHWRAEEPDLTGTAVTDISSFVAGVGVTPRSSRPPAPG